MPFPVWGGVSGRESELLAQEGFQGLKPRPESGWHGFPHGGQLPQLVVQAVLETDMVRVYMVVSLRFLPFWYVSYFIGYVLPRPPDFRCPSVRS